MRVAARYTVRGRRLNMLDAGQLINLMKASHISVGDVVRESERNPNREAIRLTEGQLPLPTALPAPYKGPEYSNR